METVFLSVSGSRPPVCKGIKPYEDKDFIIQKYGDIYGSGDYQAVIDSYNKYGENCFKELEGDFAIIIYDKRRARLISGRDKFGVKSLYYYSDGNVTAFSNRVLAFFEYLPVKKEPNRRRQFLYVGTHYRYFDTPREETFFANIFSVKQGHCAVLESGKVTQKAYWNLELLDLKKRSREDVKRDYVSLLSESIKRRLENSKNPAFMISSGMDSSSVVALASGMLGGKVDLFTTVFDEDVEYNEANEITAVAKKFGKSWSRLVVKGDTIKNDLEDILAQANEPFATITQMLHHYLSKEVKARGFDSIFGGLGGDEANCGEVEEYLFYFADLKYMKMDSRLSEDMAGWIKYHAHPLYPKNNEVLDEFFRKYIEFGSPGINRLDEERFSRYTCVFNDDFKGENLNRPALVHPYKSYLLNKLYQDLFFETIPCVLKAEEFNLNNFNLKGRSPYFDGKVMQYGFSIPVEMKYKDGGNKAILREAMRGILPDETTHNFIKKGWNAPFNKWLKTHLRGSIEALLNEPTPRHQEIYNIPVVKRLFKEHLDDEVNHMMFFWQFLNYETWHQIHFG